MSSQVLHELRQLKDVRFHAGINAKLLIEFDNGRRIALPSDHIAVLTHSNGIEAYAGYIRLFGLQTTESIDAEVWNHQDYWKFAWGDRVVPYWCFGETAWGDQYAYSVESLGNGETTVYFLDALSMTPQVVAASFTEFLEKEFLRTAKDPYDEMIQQARQKLGPLDATSHVVLAPSVLIGGPEDINNAQMMNARSAMICNGDIATQLDLGPSGKAVKGVQPYEDALQRLRLRLLWA